MKPRLFSFDIFGTVLDWQTGLRDSVRHAGYDFAVPQDMDRVIDLQGEDEQAGFKNYRVVTKDSLRKFCGMPEAVADAIGANVGKWPLFADSTEGLRALMQIAPCVATTNSDFEHGKQVQTQLGFDLSHWICAEEVRVYIPRPHSRAGFCHFEVPDLVELARVIWLRSGAV